MTISLPQFAATALRPLPLPPEWAKSTMRSTMHEVRIIPSENTRAGFTALVWFHDDRDVIRTAMRAMLVGLQHGFDAVILPLPDCRFQFGVEFGLNSLNPVERDDRLVSVAYSRKHATIAVRTQMSRLNDQLSATDLVERFYHLAVLAKDRVVRKATRESHELSIATYENAVRAAREFSLEAVSMSWPKGIG